VATTTPSTTNTPADRRAPSAYLAQPHSLAERLRWLELDAARIVRDPTSHAPEVVQWASDMLAATPISRVVT
jgi:hypothetical protein